MAERFSNLVDLHERSVARYASRPAFATKRHGRWEWITYADTKRLVDRCRAGLDALGVGAGDRVAIIADNRVEWAVACYATYGRRAAFVPMYQAQLAREWQFILADCGARVVLCATQPIFETLRRMQGELPALEHVIGLDLPDADPASFAALLARGDGAPVAPERPDPTETAGLIYTSGTTGDPKGVILSHGNICSNVNAVHEVFPVDGERSLSFLPWAHSYGQTCELHIGLSTGSAAAINDAIPNLIANLAEVKPTTLLAVPRVFNRIYDGINKQMAERPALIRRLFGAGIAAASRRNAGRRLGLVDTLLLALADRLIFAKVRMKFGGQLKYVMSGSAALSVEVAEFIDALGIMVYEGYGLTETSPIATVNAPGHRKIGSVGRALPGVRIVIDTSVTGDEKHGEVVIYGPNIMQGYHRRDAETRAAIMSDGGFRSGDMGYLDEDGFLYITGRIKEQYKLLNGKYVAPSAIEEKLKLSSLIANVMIHGANREFNVAVIVPDVEALRRRAADEGKTLAPDVTRDPAAHALVRAELDRMAGDLKGFERVKDFVLTTEDFTTDNGLLTPTLKLKRRNVLAKYGDALEALYRGKVAAD